MLKDKKKIKYIALAAAIVLMLGIISYCSCIGTNRIPVEKTDYSSAQVINDTKDWLAKTYTNGDKAIVEKYFKYKLIHAETNSPCFVRYTLHNISARDLLVFKDGRVIVIDDDTVNEVKGYNYLFPIDITNVTDAKLLALPKCEHN